MLGRGSAKCLYLFFVALYQGIKVENLRFSSVLIKVFYSIAVSSLDVHSYAYRSSADDFCTKLSAFRFASSGYAVGFILCKKVKL